MLDTNSTETENRLSYNFNFGASESIDGYAPVSPDMIYSPTSGYGFEPGMQIDSISRGGDDPLTSSFCTADTPFYFSVALPEGNYSVTVLLGDAQEASKTTIKAELRRLMIEEAETQPGEFIRRTFMVNIRTPEIPDGGKVRLKDRELENEIWAWDEKLTLEFNNSRPCICALEIERRDDIPTIFLLGDSTVCDQPGEPYCSWGQMLPRFFKPTVAVANHAESGESLTSALGARRVDKVLSQMRPGDYLFVQFGHNDQKITWEGTGAFESYLANLKRLAQDVQRLGGVPVLVTSMHRLRFDSNGRIVNSLGDFPAAVRQAAAETQSALIDLHAMSADFYEALGRDHAHKAFVKGDGTHHNNYGAYELARCIVTGIQRAELPIAEDLVDDLSVFNPSEPDDEQKFYIPVSPGMTSVRPLGDGHDQP
ncbi:rhamnogalacturonan acetylesterase [Candidatus Sumerlaeota bacterium]|nr:rhamnogalacturonan acetylesterase [Candidatus Sumerlaeota bacterium]